MTFDSFVSYLFKKTNLNWNKRRIIYFSYTLYHFICSKRCRAVYSNSMLEIREELIYAICNVISSIKNEINRTD